MTSLLVVTGPPGAGKSTVAELLAARFEPSVLVEGDRFFGFLRRGAIEPWLPAAHDQNTVVTRASAVAAGCFAARGVTTVFDGVVGPWFVDEFAAAAGLAQLDYVILLPSRERCVERVVTRVDHGFTDEAATRKMHDEFASATIEPRHVLVDPPEGADAVAELILAMLAQGSLRYGGHLG